MKCDHALEIKEKVLEFRNNSGISSAPAGRLLKKCQEPVISAIIPFPQKKNLMIESFSIDAIVTMRNLGGTSHVAVNISEMFDYYGIILLE